MHTTPVPCVSGAVVASLSPMKTFWLVAQFMSRTMSRTSQGVGLPSYCSNQLLMWLQHTHTQKQRQNGAHSGTHNRTVRQPRTAALRTTDTGYSIPVLRNDYMCCGASSIL